jgi:hypothetical protein
MFSKHFKARFAKSAQDVLTNTKGADVRRNKMTFVYDFTPELATNLGKRAVSMQRQLLVEKNAALTAKSISLELDTSTVSVNVKHKNHKVFELERSLGITATCKKPTKTSETPSIHVDVLAELTADQLDFINEYLHEGVWVRLDRQQTEIPGTADAEQKEGEVDADAE